MHSEAAVETAKETAKPNARTTWFPRVMEWAMRLLLGGLFLWAGFTKVADPIVFAEQVRNYQLIGDPLVTLVALALPWLEIFTGLGVILHRFYLGSIVLLAGMLTMFAVALASAWLRGLDIECGCFGEGQGPANYAISILRNLVLLGICGALTVMELRRSATRP